MQEHHEKALWINGDLVEYQDVLSSRSKRALANLIGDYKLIIIDEAQNIPQIGENLKILYDEFEDVQVLATGSSALELAGKTKESLAGRTITLHMHPIAIQELTYSHTPFELKQKLTDHMVYGCYPEVLMLSGDADKQRLLKELISSYLYKDVLQLSNIRNSEKIHKLLQLLAYQIGQLVSVHELAKNLALNHETVGHYLDLLQKSFVIYSLSGLSNNPRKEISKMDKYYFVDVGIRNALINDFNEVAVRGDRGGLWENFFISERIKYQDYNGINSLNYFWRRYSGAELDFVEQRNGMFYAFELKWSKIKKYAPASWVEDYPNHQFYSVTKDNYLEYVLPLI